MSDDLITKAKKMELVASKLQSLKNRINHIQKNPGEVITVYYGSQEVYTSDPASTKDYDNLKAPLVKMLSDMCVYQEAVLREGLK